MASITYIVNIAGTTLDSAEDYGYDSWIEYWYYSSSEFIPDYCANKYCRRKITNKNKIVGAHVYKCTKKVKGYIVDTDKIFIAPICKSCNGKNGYDDYNGGRQRVYIMKIDSPYLVPHPDYE